MIVDERATSRAHCGVVASTNSTPASRRTVVPRPIAGPTAILHANSTFPGEVGAFRRSSATAPGTALTIGITESILSFEHAPDSGLRIAAPRGVAASGRLSLRGLARGGGRENWPGGARGAVRDSSRPRKVGAGARAMAHARARRVGEPDLPRCRYERRRR